MWGFMSLKKQLARYKKHLNHSTQTTSEEGVETKSAEEGQAEKEKDILDQKLQKAAKGLGASVKTFEGEAMLEKRMVYPLQTEHGHYRFEEIHEAVALWQTDLKDHPLSSNQLLAKDLLFFDTETTGLGAGAGHMIFLLGTGKVIDDQFELTQYFLPGPGHETAFYYNFLTDNQNLSNLVTFNGKAFDWPRVKTRVQFVRDSVPKLPEYGHFDLLHASRRMWRPTLESVRLSTVEENILGVKRELDVPGHMAPFLYFQFLKSPKASLMDGVFEHNAEDIKSLVTLYIHLSKILHQKLTPCTFIEQYESCRWLSNLGHTKEAIAWSEKMIDELTMDNQEQAKVYELLAYNYKKLNSYERALYYFLQVIDILGDQTSILAVEVAKIYEHHLPDLEKAHFYTQKALEWLKLESHGMKDKKETLEFEITHRLERLQTKMVR
jgi:uncharacterized protein YprB with RNaseH-like and TPR domain